MELMTCSLTKEYKWVECGYCAGFDSIVVCVGCPMWQRGMLGKAEQAARWNWLLRLVRRFWPILLVLTAVFTLLGLSAKPTMADYVTHDPTHCSEEFARAVGAGSYGNRYFFSGNWIVAAGGGLICILKSVGSGVFQEVTTYPGTAQRAAQIAVVKKAVEVTGGKIASAVKLVVPRSGGPAIMFLTYSVWCQQFANNHSWMEKDYHANCGGTQNW